MGPWKKIKQKLSTHPRFGRIVSEYALSTLLFGCLSLLLDIGFAVFNLVIGILDSSSWHLSLAGYYLALLLFRGVLIPIDVSYRRKFGSGSKEYASKSLNLYLASGAFLLLTGLAMCGAVSVMLIYDSKPGYGEIMAIANATYAFYKIARAGYNLSKSRGSGNHVSIGLRNLGFAEALMSLASLTVTMLSTFGMEEEKGWYIYMKASVAFFACLIVILLSVYTVIDAKKKINKAKKDPIAAAKSDQEGQ